MKTKITAILLGLAAISAVAADNRVISIIPEPKKMERQAGEFTLNAGTRIVADNASLPTAHYLADKLAKSTGLKVPVSVGNESSAVKGTILLTTRRANSELGDEGYELAVTPDSVLIRAPKEAGVFYGMQSLMQLLPPEVFADKPGANVPWTAPAVNIEDQPRFKWRGMLLDVARHFYTKPEVERLLDLMAMQKMNTFHWHLVDDQGWRIEIRQYPRLTDVGAWRTNIGFGLKHDDGTAYGRDGRYGGFYTQSDIREVVAYAAARHITIVPEIEMPGHASAALVAYPEFSCTGKKFTTDLPGGVFDGIYCAGNDKSFEFVQNVLKEVFDLFPGKYVHIGGDEVGEQINGRQVVASWRDCPKCQARMKAEGLTREIDLEGYFIRRIEKFVNAHGRNLIGWSEIREGGLAKNAAIMDWVGGATEAAMAGHDVVMTPLADCYFDHYQSTNAAAMEPHAIGGYLPLSQVYAFEPMPKNLPPQFASHIIGAQANLWTEYIANQNYMDYMTFPRLCAMAEVGWSPQAARNWEDFNRRLPEHLQRLTLLHVNYRPAKPGDSGQ